LAGFIAVELAAFFPTTSRHGRAIARAAAIIGSTRRFANAIGFAACVGKVVDAHFAKVFTAVACFDAFCSALAKTVRK
jgi:hypothetical protein